MNWNPDTIRDLKATAVDLTRVPHVFGPWDFVYLAWTCQVCQAQQITDRFGTYALHCDTQQIVDSPVGYHLFQLPAPIIAEEAAQAVTGLPVCLVHASQDNLWGLALTAHGELSWELIEAYMRLGYLPPYTLIEHGFPEDAMRRPTRLTLWLLAGAARSSQLVRHRTQDTNKILERQRQTLLARRQVR